MRFQRRSGRKRIVAPDGSELAPGSPPQPNGALEGARPGTRWQRELAEAEPLGHSYVGRTLRLTLLAPDIVERILDGCPAPQVAELMRPFPVSWERAAGPVLLSSIRS